MSRDEGCEETAERNLVLVDGLELSQKLNPSLASVFEVSYLSMGLQGIFVACGTTFRFFCDAVVASDDHLPDASRGGVCTQCLVDGALTWLGARGLADMQGASVLLPEGRGNTLLAFGDAPEAGPALPLALLAETPADGLHQLVRDDDDKQVTLSPLRDLVEDGTQAQFGFERAEHHLHVGEGAVGAP